MSYLTEQQLSNTIDLPVSLPATDLMTGDWLVLGTVNIVAPMQLTYRFASVQLISSTVDVSQIDVTNQIYGNLGLVFLTLQPNYVNGSPGAAGALDALVAPALGIYERNSAAPVTITTPGSYSWIIANNMQPSSTSVIPASTPINFRVLVTGSVRLELDNT